MTDKAKQYLITVYDTYANQYNESSNKIDITNALDERCERLIEKLEVIEDRMDRHGFTPKDIETIGRAIRDKDELFLHHVKTALQSFLDHFNYTEEQGKKVLDELGEDGNYYNLLESNLLIIQHILYITALKRYPARIPLWDELTEEEKNEVKSKRGNPELQKKRVQFPKGFDEHAECLIKDNPNWTQQAIINELIEEYFQGDQSKYTSVWRRVFQK